jgi:hypothetical protein
MAGHRSSDHTAHLRTACAGVALTGGSMRSSREGPAGDNNVDHSIDSFDRKRLRFSSLHCAGPDDREIRAVSENTQLFTSLSRPIIRSGCGKNFAVSPLALPCAPGLQLHHSPFLRAYRPQCTQREAYFLYQAARTPFHPAGSSDEPWLKRLLSGHKSIALILGQQLDFPRSGVSKALQQTEHTMSTKAFKLKARGGGQDKRGRSKRGERFVKLDHWLLNTPAWRYLSPSARAIYIELAQRYNGSNNGEIALSIRDAARLVRVAKDTASKAFRELEDKGFVIRVVCGSFNWKVRHATTWELTAYAVGDKPPTKKFARWTEQEEKDGPKSGSFRPRLRTALGEILSRLLQAGLRLGPWPHLSTPSRSQNAARL